MFHVERMQVDDFSFAVQLANTMNWDMTPADFEFMIKLEPDGCFVLFHGQERSGIATSISFGKAGWFGNLVVKEKFRRGGAGKLLTKHAMDYLKNKGVETIGLYAYPHLVTFYENLGFEPDIAFAVLKGKATVSPTHGMLKEATKRDVPEIIAFDRQYFGANRQKLLETILFNQDNLCYVATINSKITGYVAAKVYGKTAEVGPLISNANWKEGAVMLIETILSRLNGFEIFMCIPTKEAELLKMLSKAGFKEDFRVVRMFSGSALAQNCICGPESLERG
ncbi:GNAT family N-acetyltransferase [Candidatus Bathyarchaeota archaeon]|nr:GNAT family N-acetyltransferase [Candidatus Bathyarchaeota archaeon]